MKCTFLLPLAALAVAMVAVTASPQPAAAETKQETMTRNDFESECRGAGGTPSRGTNGDGQRIWSCNFTGGDKWGNCTVNEEGMGDCYKKGYGGGKPVDRAVSDDPSRPTPGTNVPGFGQLQPARPTRPVVRR